MRQTDYLWQHSLAGNFRHLRWAAYLALAGCLGGFFYWAASAPLSGAALATGVIAAAGRNIQIQHLDGGIVAAINVSEGDRVSTGQSLLNLDDTQTRIKLNRLLQQWSRQQAMMARLTAERDGLDALPAMPPGPTRLGIDTASIDDQEREFAARLSRYRSEVSILRQRVATLVEAHNGLTAQQKAIDEQLVIMSDELKRKEALVVKGLTNRFEYTQTLRHYADLTGQRNVNVSEIASTESRRLEALEQLERLASQRVEDAVARLNEAHASLSDLEEQIHAAQNTLDRMTVRAPVDGVVVASTVNAVGSVIAPGEKVIEILPTMQELVVDARLRPQDIDMVKVGQKARLRLSALNMRLTPEVTGEVTLVSADRHVDEMSGEPYYQARVTIPDSLPSPVNRAHLHPGMPVEAFINTGERTFFEYLARPILDSFSRAFIEE
ncbi:HlyD family type I secretion periplasmic adaptor subunit [Nitratireductor sp. GISD-1A_MAKvit]|uniref:HlyD family type I secretion periplasmic adaptor subunit n=1 Tax=Nitratireductor sp. GISD-1A_MAKvit TaxID=3234198 RepID=UPI003465FB35